MVLFFPRLVAKVLRHLGLGVEMAERLIIVSLLI